MIRWNVSLYDYANKLSGSIGREIKIGRLSVDLS
jgi:hypothetical protein